MNSVKKTKKFIMVFVFVVLLRHMVCLEMKMKWGLKQSSDVDFGKTTVYSWKEVESFEVELKSHGVIMNIDNWEELLQRSTYDSWTECAEDIRVAYENAP